jgi:uncharacterized protein YecE (DUF72 family)
LGLVYSAAKGINYLAEYAARYDTVEIDQWFWSLFGVDNIKLPDSATVGDYRAAVPDDFRFTVKAPNSITLTHLYRKKKTDPLVANPYAFSSDLLLTFVDLLGPLRDVLGPVMLQFGYLNRQMMVSQREFEQRLGDLARAVAAGVQLGVELRNPRWLNESYFRLLASEGLVPVLLQGYYMPSVADVYRQWRSLIWDHQAVVVRLHGPDREGIEERTGKQWDRVVEPRDSELAEVVEMVEELLGRGLDVYVNVNNHYEGSAPLTIERLNKLLGIGA